MSQLRRQQTRLNELGIRVKVVAFDTDAMAKNYVEHSQLEWPLLLDVDRQLYRAYSMPRGNWWAIYGPQSIYRYLKMLRTGRMPGKPGCDWRQLGGDVLIDPDAMVRFHHVSTHPHDRPDIEEWLSSVQLDP